MKHERRLPLKMMKHGLGMVMGLLAAAVDLGAEPGIRITLDEPLPNRVIPWPAQAAVVLPDGFVRAADELALVDGAGKPVTAWFLPVSWWKSGGARLHG